MSDTPYTQGFKAGLAWEQERIITIINDYQHPNTSHKFNDEFCWGIIEWIKQETE